MLLHPTSLPGPWDLGVLGADAFRFVDFLRDSGFSAWQMLPVGPVGDSLSPYQMTSAFAGNPRLVDPLALARYGAEPAAVRDWQQRSATFAAAWRGFRASAGPAERAAFRAYWEQQLRWLLPYALFRICREEFGNAGWWTWPIEIRRRERGAIGRMLELHRERLREVAFEQYLFDQQWSALRSYAHDRGVALFGDIPIYVDLDSADVWWHRQLFLVSEEGQPAAVAGVPPDYFSADGQAWGNPLYDWSRMAATGFSWWVARIRKQLAHFDLLRIDHFRGLQAYWEIPAGESTARNGHWREAPGAELLECLRTAFGSLPLVAEDLGTITPEVVALRDQFGLPGMLILQFAFDGRDDNPYLPALHRRHAVLYPGTHDNDTLAGWHAALDPETRSYVCEVLACAADEIPAAMLRATWNSPAELAVITLQDLLGLGSSARMNTPGTPAGNWKWRFVWEDIPPALAGHTRGLLDAAGRLGQRQLETGT